MKCLKCHTEVRSHRYGYCPDCYKRLKRDAGSVALTCCADAKRTPTRQGGGAPQSLAVAPGKAKALADLWDEQAAKMASLSKVSEAKMQFIAANVESTMAATLRECSRYLRIVFDLPEAPEPDSEAPKERSGRRNA